METLLVESPPARDAGEIEALTVTILLSSVSFHYINALRATRIYPSCLCHFVKNSSL